MSQSLDKTKVMTAIDALVEGRSDGFKVAVYELCRQQKWADDEPGIMLAIATNQLEMLVRQYPERIAEAMARATSELEGDWRKLQAKLNLTAMKSTQTATQITNRLTDTQLLIEQELSRTERLMMAEREAMLQAMATERAEVRQWLADERKAMEGQALALAEQQKQVIEAKTTELIARAVKANQERADSQVKQIVKGVRGKHYWEAMAYACVTAAFIFSLAWSSGWMMSSRSKAASTWGDIARWNQDELAACIEVAQTTCNFHIEMPK